MQIRVCHIVTGVAAGGLQKHVVDLATSQACAGCIVSVIAPSEITVSLPSNIRSMVFRPERSRHNPLALLEIARHLRRIQPDVVHAHAGKASAMSRTAIRLARLRRSALVATIHNQKKSLSPYRNADVVIAVSDSTAKQFRAHFPPVRVVHNGVAPPSGPAPARIPPQTSRPLAVAVGRLVIAKGFDILLDAWNDIDADLWIVGDGPERERLKGMVERAELDGRVHFLGQRDDAPSILGLADLVVIPSRREGFSYVMAEALLARRPIVATRVPGPVDILPERFLAPVGDRDAIRERLAETFADLEGARAAFTPVWKFARDELTIERMAKKTIDVYLEALSMTS